MLKSEEPDVFFLHTYNLPSSSISIWTCRTDIQGWVVGVTYPRLDVSFRNPFSFSLNTVLIVLHFTVHCQHEADRSKKPFCLCLFTWHLVSPRRSSPSQHRFHWNWLPGHQHAVSIPQHRSHSLNWWHYTLRGCASKLPGEMFARRRPKISKCQQWAFHNCKFTSAIRASASRSPQAAWTSAGQASCQSCGQLTNRPTGKQKSRQPRWVQCRGATASESLVRDTLVASLLYNVYGAIKKYKDSEHNKDNRGAHLWNKH